MDLAQVRKVIAEAVQPGHFFVAPGLCLQWLPVHIETIPWELFQGRLLDRRHTREERVFESWNIHQLDGGRLSDEPLLSVKLDVENHAVHVTRGLQCYVQEGYDAGDNVFMTREAQRWTRELAATISLEEAHWHLRLSAALLEAVVGQSRLPLTSLEAPLPAFTLGKLAYFPVPCPQGAEPETIASSVLEARLADITFLHTPRLLEWMVRSSTAEGLPALTRLFLDRWRALGRISTQLGTHLVRMFNDIALSPWTAFIERALQFVRLLEELGGLARGERIDLLCRLLRLLTRHLTAYDLITFHYRGANYPDALLLDALLKELFGLVKESPDLFLDNSSEKRRRRGAICLGWLVRRFYEGHAVPDAPTAPGEMQRVLPAEFPRVPEEQIQNIARRKRRLYSDDPLPRALTGPLAQVLRQAGRDLREPMALRELGLALFIDRPFGVFKSPAEPDRTPLFSYLALSRSIAIRRLAALASEPLFFADSIESVGLRAALEALPVLGMPVQNIPEERRPVVSLADARKVAEDFMILRAFGQPAQGWLNKQAGLDHRHPSLIVRGSIDVHQEKAAVLVFDDQMRQRLEISFRRDSGYALHSDLGINMPNQ